MAWSRHCRARTSACGMRRVRASQVYRRARPACPLPSEGSRSPSNPAIGVMDSAMASTACSACWAAVPDKMGRQQLAALASSGLVIRPAPLRSPECKKAGVECRIAWHSAAHSSRAAPRCLPAAATVSSSDPKGGIRQPTWHVRCLIPSSRDCPATPWYAFGLPVARVTRSGQEQPGALVFGQLFGPPRGGSLEPLWAPPTIWDSSFSSSVRRVSLDSVSFFSFMESLPRDIRSNRRARFGREGRPPARRSYRPDLAGAESHYLRRSPIRCSPFGDHCRSVLYHNATCLQFIPEHEISRHF